MKSRTMKKSILAISAIFASSSFFAQQNLVDNGGFESNNGKIKKLGQIDLAEPWTSPTAVRADIFMSDAKDPLIGTKANAFGKEDPKEGENYAGIMAFSYGNKESRSYLSTKLTQPLKKGMKYCVSFYVSLADVSKYSSNNIGAMLTPKEYKADGKTPLIETKTSVLHPDNKVMNQMYNWEKVCATFTADGNEKYITIGNFTKDSDVKYETNKKPKDVKAQKVGAYYYIDDVQVIVVDEENPCDCYSTDVDVNKFTTTVYQKTVTIQEKWTPKEKIEAQALYFAFGKDALTPQAQFSLDKVVEQMKKDPNLRVTLTGYSNEKEAELAVKKSFYTDMDKKRAEQAKKYLISKGIDGGRITVSGGGSSSENTKEIKEGDDDDLKMAKTRRVEFTVQ